MSPREKYSSVPERIEWTPVGEFKSAIDKGVLAALATFCDFETGEGWARGVSLKTLSARAKLKPRRVQRALSRLKNARPPWIKGTGRHRHATRWDICIGRLPTTWITAKVVAGLDVKIDAQRVDLNVNSDAPIPSTDLTPVQQNKSAPPLRGGTPPKAKNAEEGVTVKGRGESPQRRRRGTAPDDSSQRTFVFEVSAPAVPERGPDPESVKKFAALLRSSIRPMKPNARKSGT